MAYLFMFVVGLYMIIGTVIVVQLESSGNDILTRLIGAFVSLLGFSLIIIPAKKLINLIRKFLQNSKNDSLDDE